MSDAAPHGDDDSVPDEDLIALSGLLDGELAPERAAPLRQRIADDPRVRARWQALRDGHARWTSMARTAQAPVAMPPLPVPMRGGSVPAGWVWVLVIALTAGRLLPKFMPVDLLTALLLHGLLLGLALAMIQVATQRLGVRSPGHDAGRTRGA